MSPRVETILSKQAARRTLRFAFAPVIAALLILLWAGLAPPPAKLVAGPMNGYSEMREVLLWAQTDRPAEVVFEYYPENDPSDKRQTEPVTTSRQTDHIARVVVGGLEPGTVYRYEVLLDGKQADSPGSPRFRAQTLWQWRSDPPPFRIALGSCLFINEPKYDRPGDGYGAGYEILETIAEAQPDAMLWLGDNTYLREADWHSRSGIFHRYRHTRATPEMQRLLAEAHHYATWDDHDYGPNNSNRSFRNKRDTRDAFNLYWGNPDRIFPDGGIATKFSWQDCDFFLLDNRWYRAPNRRETGERTLLGDAQIEWLIDALKTSRAPFKFVAMGGQFLNTANRYEVYGANYPEERDRILRALRAERIEGVVFLSGDRHFSEFSRLERPGQYPLCEFTVSPLTSGAAGRLRDEENTLRVEGSFVGERNFGTIEVSGKRTDRKATFSLFDASGALKWSGALRARDLEY